jgi:hypothetical protein
MFDLVVMTNDPDAVPDTLALKYEDTVGAWDFGQQVIECVEQVPFLGNLGEVILFSVDDMILYRDMDERELRYMARLLEQSDDVDFIRLIRCGNAPLLKHSKNLYSISSNSNDLFSMQPTLWKSDVFLDLCEEVRSSNIWEFEQRGSNWLRTRKIKGLFYFVGNEKKRGKAHWDSSIYPYIATAIVKGKWLTSEYPRELQDVFEEFGIDKNIRGER